MLISIPNYKSVVYITGSDGSQLGSFPGIKLVIFGKKICFRKHNNIINLKQNLIKSKQKNPSDLSFRLGVYILHRITDFRNKICIKIPCLFITQKYIISSHSLLYGVHYHTRIILQLYTIYAFLQNYVNFSVKNVYCVHILEVYRFCLG